MRERLLELIRTLGISVLAFEKNCGLKPSSVRNTKRLGDDKIELILKAYPQVSRAWLIAGEGPMFSEANATAKASECIVSSDNEAPLVPEEVSRSAEVNVWNYVHTCRNVERITLAQLFPNHDMFYRVISNAMKPAIEKGDVLVVARLATMDIVNGECYLIDTKHLGMLVRTMVDQGDAFLCIPSAINYQEQVIAKKDIFDVYQIVGLIRADVSPGGADRLLHEGVVTRTRQIDNLLAQQEKLLDLLHGCIKMTGND